MDSVDVHLHSWKEGDILWLPGYKYSILINSQILPLESPIPSSKKYRL